MSEAKLGNDAAEAQPVAAAKSAAKPKPQGAQKPGIIVFALVARVFVGLSSLACLVQYIIKIVTVYKQKGAMQWALFQSYFISAVNILVSLLLILSVSVKRLSGTKKWLYKRASFTCQPINCCIILLYMAIAQAPTVLFVKNDNGNIAESVLLVINLCSCAIVFLYGFYVPCKTAEIQNYYLAAGFKLPEDFRLGI